MAIPPASAGDESGARTLPLQIDCDDDTSSRTLAKFQGAAELSHPVGTLPSIAALGLPPARTRLNPAAHNSTPSSAPRYPAPQQGPPAKPLAVNLKAVQEDAKRAITRLHQFDPRGAIALVKSHPEYQTVMHQVGSLQAALNNQIKISRGLEAQLAQVTQENQALILEGGKMVARQDALEQYQKRANARKLTNGHSEQVDAVLHQKVHELRETTSELQRKVIDLQAKLLDEMEARRKAEYALETALKKKEQADA